MKKARQYYLKSMRDSIPQPGQAVQSAETLEVADKLARLISVESRSDLLK